MVAPARVVAKREFAGSWEYLLDEAIFTAPPHPAWSGAALISREGKLVGVGSLIVGDATGTESSTPGNMFVPIDRLPPILADLIANGRVVGRRAVLGSASPPRKCGGRLLVSRVTPGGPGGQGRAPARRYHRRRQAARRRAAWPTSTARSGRRATPATVVPLEVLQGKELRRFEIKSMNRLDHLKLKSSL